MKHGKQDRLGCTIFVLTFVKKPQLFRRPAADLTARLQHLLALHPRVVSWSSISLEKSHLTEKTLLFRTRLGEATESPAYQAGLDQLAQPVLVLAAECLQVTWPGPSALRALYLCPRGDPTSTAGRLLSADGFRCLFVPSAKQFLFNSIRFKKQPATYTRWWDDAVPNEAKLPDPLLVLNDWHTWRADKEDDLSQARAPYDSDRVRVLAHRRPIFPLLFRDSANAGALLPQRHGRNHPAIPT
ncbi:hypothetical protein PG995_007633 [Apiospora arundinis]